MEVFRGTATFQGIAIGKIQYLRRNEQHIRQYTVENARREIRRFKKARERALEALRFLQEKSAQELGEAELKVFQGQIDLLEGGSFTRAIESMIWSERVNAANAIVTTRNEMKKAFSGLEDEVIRNRILDIQDISDRLILILEGIAREEYQDVEPFIVMANDLTPAEIMELDQQKMLAFVSHEGSSISHTAIISKTLSIPALIGIETDPAWDGKMAVVDGYDGVLYLEPDQETLEKYESRREEELKEREYLTQFCGLEDVTEDGRKVELYANIRSLEDLDSVLESGAGGIGLLRSEFQYLGRENYPREVELFRAYRKVADAMGEKLVIIRTLDIGADKKAEYMHLPDEANPAMGNRGIRVCLERKRMFKAQLRAIYRASVYGNLAIMYPMVTSIEEVHEIKEIVREVEADLARRKITCGKVQHGIMVETPAAVMIADELAQEMDFLSLGTNDLTQYVLAMDRKNRSLDHRYNDHHPAVLKMIRMTVESAHRQGRWVAICGELAGDTTMTRSFLEMGVDVLSVVPASILPVRKTIREINLSVSPTEQ